MTSPCRAKPAALDSVRRPRARGKVEQRIVPRVTTGTSSWSSLQSSAVGTICQSTLEPTSAPLLCTGWRHPLVSLITAPIWYRTSTFQPL